MGALELPGFLHCVYQCHWLPSYWVVKLWTQSSENLPYSQASQIDQQDANNQAANWITSGIDSRFDASVLLHHIYLLHLCHLWNKLVPGPTIPVL